MKEKIISRATTAIQVYPQLRYGQSIFNTAFLMYPKEADKLRETKFDCYYRDDKVDEFLNMLEQLISDEVTN